MTPTACGLLCLSGQSCLLPLPWDLGPACPAVLAAKCCCPQYGGSQASCFRGAGPWALEWPHCMARKGASDSRAKVAALTVRACLVGHSTPTLHVTHGLPSTAHLVWPPGLAAPPQAGYTLEPPQPHPRPSLTCPRPQPTVGLRAGVGTPLGHPSCWTRGCALTVGARSMPGRAGWPGRRLLPCPPWEGEHPESPTATSAPWLSQEGPPHPLQPPAPALQGRATLLGLSQLPWPTTQAPGLQEPLLVQ